MELAVIFKGIVAIIAGIDVIVGALPNDFIPYQSRIIKILDAIQKI